MNNQVIPFEQRMVHIRFGGQSMDLSLPSLAQNEGTNDQNIRRALATYLNVSPRKLNPYIIERHANGNMTVRPEAVFG